MAKKTWERKKDPDEVVDYKGDWAAQMADMDDDVITSSVWIVPTGVTKESDSFTDTYTTIWFSGGTSGESYECVNRITTAGGRTLDQTWVLKAKDR